MTWFASIRMLLRHFPRKVGLARSGTALRFRQGRLPSSCFGTPSLSLSQLGARARGVVVIDKLVTAAELDDMAAVGVQGVRRADLNAEAARWPVAATACLSHGEDFSGALGLPTCAGPSGSVPLAYGFPYP
jgi:hypothetical protein